MVMGSENILQLGHIGREASTGVCLISKTWTETLCMIKCALHKMRMLKIVLHRSGVGASSN